MDEFAELLWDSGPIVMQAQNSLSNNNTNTDYIPKGSTGTAPYDDTLIRSSTPEETTRMKMMMDAVPKILQFGSPEPMPAPDLFSLSGIPPTCHRDGDLVRKSDAETDTHTVPGVDYPILGASDHCLDGELLTNLNPNPLLPLPHSKPLDMQVAVPVHKSGQEETLVCNKQPTNLPLHRGEVGSGLINFSHFSRPIALAKASLQSAERLRSNEKASTSCNNNVPLEYMVIMPSSALRPAPQPSLLSQPTLLGGCLRVLNRHRFCDNNNNVPPPSSKPAEAQRNQLLEEDKEKDKCAQPMLATSSVCSRNVYPTQLKRKTLEEDSSTHPEDAEDESVELKMLSTSNGTGPKRSRTAEVHNLSERRRRDRINEKMRVLQELIPNCNKVDKASMLDEAIEYLKTLQVQVQMMMMGTGMFMPPIMLPPGLHHMPVASYPQMQIGMGMGQSMGMGMGYGLGFMDFNHSPVHAGPTPAPAAPLLPSLPQAGHIPLNFMPLMNGSVFPFDNKIPSTPSFRPQHVGPSSDYRANICPMSSQFEVAAQGEKRHADTSGEVGVSPTDTTNSETANTSWC